MQNRYQSLMQEINAGESIVIDAGTGSELQRRNVPMLSEAWCALGTETHPETLLELHKDYIKAGARIITANTFSSTRDILESVGLDNKFSELNKRSVEIACEARVQQDMEDAVLIAGSITHIIPASGNTHSPRNNPRQFEDNCTEMAAIHKAAGADLIMAEMMGDPIYAPCVIRAAKANDLPVWIGLSSMSEDPSTLIACATPSMPMQEALPEIVNAGGDVMGIMHTSASCTAAALELLKTFWNGPTMAYPDSVAARKKGETNLDLSDVLSEDDFVDYCQQWQAQGVQVFGGCCGLTVSHIQALTNTLHTTA